MINRIYQHFFTKKGKFKQDDLEGALFHNMPGSTKTEREIVEQYLIIKARANGIVLRNANNPMGGRMADYNKLLPKVLQKYWF